MQIRFEHKGESWQADLTGGVDISIAVSGDTGVRAWGVRGAEIAPHREGGFVGSILAGASVNFNDVRFNPHAHGTHTECLGHITREAQSVNAHPPKPWMLTTVVTITPENTGSDGVITQPLLEAAIPNPDTESLVLRTLPNPESKRHMDHSGTNPPYLEAKAAAWLNAQGVCHLLLDLPSVDREEDGGALQAHKAFWGLPDQPRPEATITELIYVPEAVADGKYLLNLQMAALENDASPSRPILFPISRAPS